MSTLLVFPDDSVFVDQFKITFSDIEQRLHGIDVVAIGFFEQLEPQPVKRVVRAFSVLYLAAMNGLEKTLAGRQLARHELVHAAAPCLQMHLSRTSVVRFVSLLVCRKHRQRSAIGDVFVQDICSQLKMLFQVAAQKFSLLW